MKDTLFGHKRKGAKDRYAISQATVIDAYTKAFQYLSVNHGTQARKDIEVMRSEMIKTSQLIVKLSEEIVKLREQNEDLSKENRLLQDTIDQIDPTALEKLAAYRGVEMATMKLYTREQLRKAIKKTY